MLDVNTSPTQTGYFRLSGGLRAAASSAAPGSDGEVWQRHDSMAALALRFDERQTALGALHDSANTQALRTEVYILPREAQSFTKPQADRQCDRENRTKRVLLRRRHERLRLLSVKRSDLRPRVDWLGRQHHDPSVRRKRSLA
jgi:hypothetical protein